MTNIAMPSLNLQLRYPGDDMIEEEIFPIAKSAVESGREDHLLAAARDIVLKLIELDPPPSRVNLSGSFDPLCLEIAEQIPYDSEKMLDVLKLLELGHTSPQLTAELTGKVELTKDQQREAFGYKDLSSVVLWEFWDAYRLDPPYEEKDFSRCLNWHTFVSYLYQRGLVIGSDAPVGFLNEMLENREPHVHSEEDVRKREVRTMAASQYILRWGRELLEHLLTTYNSSSPAFDKRSYRWSGSGAQGLEKWHIWRETLHIITTGDWDESERSVSAEAKELFAVLVKLMDKIEAEVALRPEYVTDRDQDVKTIHLHSGLADSRPAHIHP